MIYFSKKNHFLDKKIGILKQNTIFANFLEMISQFFDDTKSGENDSPIINLNFQTHIQLKPTRVLFKWGSMDPQNSISYMGVAMKSQSLGWKNHIATPITYC